MGAEQSNNRQQSKSSTPNTDVKRLLEQQRRIYEEKIKKLKEERQPPSPNVLTTRTAESHVDVLIQQQIREFQNLVLHNNSSRSTLPGSAPLVPPGTSRGETNNSLYPTITAERKMTYSPQPKSFGYVSKDPGQSAQKNSVREDFVFVKKSFEPSAPVAPSAPVQRNNRPISNPRPNTAQNNEDDQLNCRTCHNKYGLTIYQCQGGHSSCKDCRMRGARCGVCHLIITDMRNITLEAYISERRVPCPNENDGCCAKVKLCDLDAHCKECAFKILACPFGATLGGCFWQGKLSQILSHFEDKHPGQRAAKVDTEMYLPNICTDYKEMYLVEMGTFYFLVHVDVNKRADRIHMAVQLIGTGMSAAKWTYEIQVYNKREPRRKYVYTDICQSDSVCVNEIFKEAKCVSIPLAYAMNFVNEGLFTYKFYIKKDFDKGPNRRRRGGRADRGRGIAKT